MVGIGRKSSKEIFNTSKLIRIDIIESYGALPLLPLNIGQINQVFMNLLINASDAIPDHGEIRIKTSVEDQNVVISIQDTGRGIKPEDLDKIFDPFFTKKIGGTGLGLSISYRIIKDHGGKIEVESIPDKGTAFTIRLPIEIPVKGGV